MNSLADSDAVLNAERMLAQHQAALTLLQGMLTDPQIAQVRWLDLASGRGQIILHLAENLSAVERRKLSFLGFDIDNSYARTAARIADSLDLANSAFEIGEIGRFWEVHSTTGPFQFITLTNTVHEISPIRFSEIIARCIERLDETGRLFIYDMETLPTPELGAVVWSAAEIRVILSCLTRALGAEAYEPSVGKWVHQRCNGWNAQMIRSHMGLPVDFRDRIPNAISITSAKVEELLRVRLQNVKKALEGLTRFGPETDDEAVGRDALLFQLWALTRALEGVI